MIRKSIGDGCYYPVPIAHGHKSNSDRHALYASLAAPHLERLQQTVIWPSDFLVYSRYKMVSLETTRRTASLALNTRYKIGFRVDMFLSAPGRAYLAFCSDAERERILAHYRKHPPRNALSASVLRNSMDQIISETRTQGYAVRDPMWGGGEVDISESDDHFDAIAVPLLYNDRIFGCINIVWVRKYNLRQKIIRDNLASLKATAVAIAEALYHA